MPKFKNVDEAMRRRLYFLQHLSSYRRYARACLNDDGVATTKRKFRKRLHNAGFITGNSRSKERRFWQGLRGS